MMSFLNWRYEIFDAKYPINLFEIYFLNTKLKVD